MNHYLKACLFAIILALTPVLACFSEEQTDVLNNLEGNGAVTEEQQDLDVIEGVIEEESYDAEEKPILQGRLSKFKSFIVGERATNAIMAGMWSKHFSGKDYREVNNLAAVQYKGIFAGTFSNSYSRQVITVAIARNLYKKRFGKHTLFDVGYKIGPMYGYKEGVPDIGGFTLLPIACLGISYRDIGVTLNLFPANALSFNTFIYPDKIFSKIKSKFKKTD